MRTTFPMPGLLRESTEAQLEWTRGFAQDVRRQIEGGHRLLKPEVDPLTSLLDAGRQIGMMETVLRLDQEARS